MIYLSKKIKRKKYSNDKSKLNTFTPMLQRNKIDFWVSARISINFSSNGGEESYIKTVVDYYMKVKSKMRSSYVQCSH